MREPVLAKILRFLVYAVAFVPLIIFENYISPFHFGKVVIFRSLVEVMAVLYLLLVWKEPQYRPKMTKIGWAFLLFALAFSITTITSVIPYSSFWGSLERMGGLFTFWHYFIYFVILTAVFKKEEEWYSLFNLAIVIGVLSAFYGFLQKTELEWVVGSGNRARIFGTIGNAALFAGYQIVVGFLSLMLLFRKNISTNFRIFYGGSAMIMIIAALMTAVRGSILGIGVGFLVFALLYSSSYKSKKAKKAFLGLVTLLVIFVGFAQLMKNSSFVQSSGYLKRVTDFSFTSYTVQTRFWAWEAGFKGWKEGPKTILLGWGPENFNIPFSKYFNPKFYQGPGSETLFDRAHNMFVEILVTMGLLGFLSYVWIFIASLRLLWKKIHDKEHLLYGVGLTALLFAYAIHNSFIFDTSANFIAFFTVLGFISFLAIPKSDPNQKLVKPKRINEGLWTLSLFGLLIFITVFIYAFNVKPSIANYTTTRGIVAGWAGDFKGAVAKFQEAVSYDVPGKYEYRHRFAQFLLEQTQSKEITPESAEVIKLAITETEKNIEENKPDYLPYLYTARLYVTLGKDDPESEYNDKALELSLKAIELAPDFVRAYYEIGQAYLNKRDLVSAAKYFRIAAELNPEVGLSIWYWGIVEAESGNLEEGLKIIERAINSGYKPSENDIGKLINIYVKTNNINGLIWGYETLVSARPDNPQYHASLAAAYARVGRVADATKEAKAAAAIDSAFEPEAKAFIESIGGSW